MLKFLTLLVIAVLLNFQSTIAQSQSATLRGTITDNNGIALAGINVQIEGLASTQTDVQGHYAFGNLKPGKVGIHVSGTGFEHRHLNLTITGGQANVQNVTVTHANQALQQVEILGNKKSSYRSDYTFGATKTATYLKDIPQSVSVVTKELIADRQIEKAWDVMKLMSGVNRYSNYNDIVIRGFHSGENQPRLINGMRAAFGYFDQPVTANLERIEVIKGPASALFGNAIPGGSINFVTKKPLQEKRYGLNFTTGSFNTIRAAADVTGPIVDSTILFRVNAAYSNADSFRSLQFNENYMLAPSFSFFPSKKTAINVDLVYSSNNSRIDRGQPVFGGSSPEDLYKTPISLAIGAPNDFYRVKNLQLSANLTHEFSDRLSFNGSYMKFGWTENLQEHRTSNGYGVNGAGLQMPTMVAMQVLDRIQKIYSDNVNLFFRYKVATGTFKHTILLGYDNIQQTRPVGSTANVARGYRNATNTGSIASYNPANKSAYLLDASGNPVPNVAHFDLQNVQYPIRNFSSYFFSPTIYNPSRYAINAAYFQDQLTYQKFHLLIGLRQEYYTDYTDHTLPTESKVKQHALIPRIGLTYTLDPHVNLYATYTEGYQPQSAATFSNPKNGGPFDPSTSNMIEGGAKSSLFEDHLSLNFAIYRILQKNTLVLANDPVNPDLLRQRGEEESKGFELEAVGNLTSNLSVNANYAFNQAVIKAGLPAEVGLQKANAPKHLAGVWLKYGFIKGPLSGLGIGAGGNYASRRNTELIGLQLPAYTTIDAAAYYTFKQVRLSVNLNNLLNETYWTSGFNYTRIFPGEPRNVMFNISKLF